MKSPLFVIFPILMLILGYIAGGAGASADPVRIWERALLMMSDGCRYEMRDMLKAAERDLKEEEDHGK